MTSDAIKDLEINIAALSLNLAGATANAIKLTALAATSASTLGLSGIYMKAQTKTQEESLRMDEKSITNRASNFITNKELTMKAGNDINQKGSNVGSLEGNVNYEAANNVNILASADIYEKTKSQSSTTQTNTVKVGGLNEYSANLDTSKTAEKSGSTNYNNSVVFANNGKVTIKSGKDTSIVGGNVESKEAELIVGGNLRIESLQNTSYSESKTRGGSVGYGSSGVNLGYNKQDANSDRAWVDAVSGINTTGKLTIKTNDLNMKGSFINSGTGEMDLTAKSLKFEDLKDFDNSDSQGFSVGLSGGGTRKVSVDKKTERTKNGVSGDVGFNRSGTNKEGITRATIGAGTITDLSTGLEMTTTGNRDLSKQQEITKDEITGALDMKVSSNDIKALGYLAGSEELKKDLKKIGKGAVEFMNGAKTAVKKAVAILDKLGGKERAAVVLEKEKNVAVNDIIEKAKRMKEVDPKAVKELTDEVNKKYGLDLENMSMEAKAKILADLNNKNKISEIEIKLRNAIYANLDLDKNYVEFRDKMGNEIIKNLSTNENIIKNLENLNDEKWKSLPKEEKAKILQSISDAMQNKIGNSSGVKIDIRDDMNENNLGGYINNKINVNEKYADDYGETLDTIVHEGQHAVQDYLRNNDNLKTENKNIKTQLDIFNSNFSENMYGRGDYYYDNPVEVDSWSYADSMKNKFNEMIKEKINSQQEKISAKKIK